MTSLPPAWAELRAAALQTANSSCAASMQRARRRLHAAISALEAAPHSGVTAREQLLRDLAVFALDIEDEDPVAAGLAERARALGVVS